MVRYELHPPLLELVQSAGSEEEVTTDLARIASWGLGALAHVVDYLDTHREPFPARKGLLKRAVKSSRTLRLPSVQPSLPELNDFSQELATLEGAAITGETFCSIVRSALGNAPTNTASTWIDLERSNSLTGTRLSIEYRANTSTPAAPPTTWSWSQRVVANGTDVLWSKRGGPVDDAVTMTASSTLAGYIDHAFALGPAVPVDISVEVTADPPDAGTVTPTP